MGVIMLSEGTRNEKISYVLAGYGSHAERGNQECGCWSVLTIPRSYALFIPRSTLCVGMRIIFLQAYPPGYPIPTRTPGNP